MKNVYIFVAIFVENQPIIETGNLFLSKVSLSRIQSAILLDRFEHNWGSKICTMPCLYI